MNCPHCGEYIEDLKQIRLCNKENAKQRSKDIKNICNTVDTLRIKTKNKLLDYINEEWLIGHTKTTSDVLYDLHLNESSKGDLLREILDSFVCKGILNKIFQRGRKGHQYTKLGFINICNFFVEEEGRCKLFLEKNGKFRKLTPELINNFTKIIDIYKKEGDSNSR